MADDDMPVDDEHFDSIPWSSLIPQTQDRPWLVYVVAGAIVAVVVGMLAARSLPSRAPLAEPLAAATAIQAAEETSPPTSHLISEADLRAEIEPGESGVAAAVMRAEWFVTDFFTIDGAGGRAAELAGALGRPFHDVASDVTTYVEWARAWEVVAERDGRYRVLVAFRSITATGGGFERGLVRGVSIQVQVGAEGGTRVVDLPEPVEMPPPPTLAAPAAPELVSDTIASAALVGAAAWGDPVSVIEGTLIGGEWRVLVEVADEHGTIWPLIVSVNDVGQN